MSGLDDWLPAFATSGTIAGTNTTCTDMSKDAKRVRKNAIDWMPAFAFDDLPSLIAEDVDKASPTVAPKTRDRQQEMLLESDEED
jgi:hypothetical protein